MFNKILAAVDGSKQGLKAAQVASEMAKKFDAKLIILTVAKPVKLTPKVKQYIELEQLSGEPKYVLDAMTENVIDEAKKAAAAAGVKSVETLVEEGYVARTILSVAKRMEVELIVMGSRGMGDVGSYLLGSVSHKVSSVAKCHVMTVY